MNRSVIFGGALLGLIALIAILAPLLGTGDPARIDPTERNRRPGAEQRVRGDDGRARSVVHWMGTDSLGRDVYTRVVYGARVSLLVGVTVAFISAAAGLVIGLLAGYLRWLDAPVMRVMDGLMSIPAILLAIGLVTLSRAGLRTVIVAIVIPEVPRVTRLVRAVVLSLREEPYVEAATALGARTPALLRRHILPNTLAPLIVQATISFPVAILAEAALSYLGLGTQPPHPSWGLMLREAQAFLVKSPGFAIFPGTAIALTVLGLNLLGDGLRDLLDPKMAG